MSGALAIYLLLTLTGVPIMGGVAFLIWWHGRHPWKYHEPDTDTDVSQPAASDGVEVVDASALNPRP